MAIWEYAVLFTTGMVSLDHHGSGLTVGTMSRSAEHPSMLAIGLAIQGLTYPAAPILASIAERDLRRQADQLTDNNESSTHLDVTSNPQDRPLEHPAHANEVRGPHPART